MTSNLQTLTHWKYPRQLNLSEVKRLGSFPDDYQVKSEQIGKYLIGMSVPPKMTEQVAQAVCKQWLSVKDAGHPPALGGSTPTRTLQSQMEPA